MNLIMVMEDEVIYEVDVVIIMYMMGFKVVNLSIVIVEGEVDVVVIV